MSMKSARNMYRSARRSGETVKPFRMWARANLKGARIFSAKLSRIVSFSE